VIAAVGDIACNSFPSAHTRRCRYDQVAKAIEQIHPDRFLALGDEQYLHGSYRDFRTYYDRYFGGLKEITAPVPGNHETYTPLMRGYRRYFGALAEPKGWWYPNQGLYYSYDLGGWHFIALNSQLCKGTTWDPGTGHDAPITRNIAEQANGCAPGSAEYEWLMRDLAMHPNSAYPCTVAYYHHPIFAWWPYKPTAENLRIQPLWRALDDAGVDLVLNGHFHNYQRWVPQDAYGIANPDGMTEIIAGTGGDTFENDFPTSRQQPANLAAYQGHSFGVLQLTLHPTSYDFSFVTAPGQRPYQDSGTASCH
jgi:hypothetical protein